VISAVLAGAEAGALGNAPASPSSPDSTADSAAFAKGRRRSTYKNILVSQSTVTRRNAHWSHGRVLENIRDTIGR
jgi:hypothetical protein